MAWLEEHPTSGRFKLCFRWAGRKFKRTVKAANHRDAEAIRVRVEENIALLERGRLELPAGGDLVTFLLSDGKLVRLPRLEATTPVLTLREVVDRYLEIVSNGAMEANSVATVRLHLGHFVMTLGDRFPISTLTLDNLQRHVDQRARKQYRGKLLSPVTLRREVASFRACWNWATQAKKLTDPFPGRGLMYPKADEKPPFQTWVEIERQITRNGLTDRSRDDLWDCLFLTVRQIEELLTHVREAARQPFLYPMVCFAAHTGARRSEVIRVQVTDVDLDGGSALVREKKKARTTRTTRRVPLSPFLVSVLRDWLAAHPGGPHLFAQRTGVSNSKKRRTAPTGVTRDEAHDHLRRALDHSKWQVLRGWHIFRHSFCSNCAASGVDQRLINAWVGHQTEEMVKRYRHLIPHQERQAIQRVFGTYCEPMKD